MSVIGRLDGQVEEVIIKPVGRRHAGEDEGAPETASVPPVTRRDGPRETRREEQAEIRRDDGELPVWLL